MPAPNAEVDHDMVGGYIAAMVFLVPCAIRDAREQSVPVSWLAAGGIAAVITATYGYYAGRFGLMNLLLALSPGGLLIAISVITHQQVGIADGICSLIMGLFLGSPGVYMILVVALLLSSIWAAILLVTGRGNRASRIPWLPFVTAGLVSLLILESGLTGHL